MSARLRMPRTVGMSPTAVYGLIMRILLPIRIAPDAEARAVRRVAYPTSCGKHSAAALPLASHPSVASETTATEAARRICRHTLVAQRVLSFENKDRGNPRRRGSTAFLRRCRHAQRAADGRS